MTDKKEEQKKEETAPTEYEQSAEPKTQQTTEAKHHHKKDEHTKELQEKLAAAVKEKEELFARLQRLSADYANFQKRSAKQTADTVCFEREKIIKSLLPALDDFERTIRTAASDEKTNAIINGIKIIYDHILDILKSCDVEQITAVGRKFDPFLHEAINQRSQSDKEDNIILEENQKGYKVGGRVIRPSRVIVNKLKISPAATEKQVQQPEPPDNQQEETTDVE